MKNKSCTTLIGGGGPGDRGSKNLLLIKFI